MSETNADPDAAGQAEGAGVTFDIEHIFVKDLSFEAPKPPSTVVDANWKPAVKLNLNSEAKRQEDDRYDVTLTITVTATQGDATAFLAEVHQSGRFKIKGLGEQELAPALGSYCPSILFPYAREAISNMVNRGGFPPVNLMPVNFDALYAQQMQRATEGGDTPQ